MALENQKITVIEGGRRKLKQTSEVERKYKSVAIGTAEIPVSESGGSLVVGAPVAVSAATASAHAMTKSQVDAADAALSSAYQAADAALGVRMNAAEAELVAQDLRLDLAESEIVTLQSDVAASDGDIVVLEGQVAAILANIPAHHRFISNGVTATFTVPFTISDDNTVLDVIVYVDGRKMEIDTTGGSGEDFRKIGLNQIQLTPAAPSGKRVVAWKQGTSVASSATGTGEANTGSNVGTGSQVFKDKLGVVLRMRSIVAGVGVSVVQNVNDITISSTGGSNLLSKQMQNLSGVTIPAGVPIAKMPNGSIARADSDGAGGLQNFIGISGASIADATQGAVILVGANLAGVITGLGFAPGQDIYLSESGGYTNTPATAFSNNDDSIIKIGVADCAAGAASSTATDLIMFPTVEVRP